eukprot:3576342-Lingulodinium_polyedra.AAC.1
MMPPPQGVRFASAIFGHGRHPREMRNAPRWAVPRQQSKVCPRWSLVCFSLPTAIGFTGDRDRCGHGPRGEWRRGRWD